MPAPDGAAIQTARHRVPLRDEREPVVCLIASLAPGGAERIVLDWLQAEAHLGRDVELAVVHRRDSCLPVPRGVRTLNRGPESAAQFVARLAVRWAAVRAPVAVHLVPDELIDVVCAAGLRVVPVIHNVREGWRNDPAKWHAPSVPMAVACAEVVRGQMIESGCRVPVQTVRHRPRVGPRGFDPSLRRSIRETWRVGDSTLLVGMVGAIKPQKDYPRAITVLAQLAKRRDAVLVIVGGLLGRAALAEYDRLFATVLACGVQTRLRLPGFVEDVEPWLAAFDVLLNTSRHEGLSIAVQEALDAGMPVVATDVGGQHEIHHPGLTLLAPDSAPDAFAAHLAGLPVRHALHPSPHPRAPRIWSMTLSHRTPAAAPIDTLFVTANLNAGGAQRSLVNLAMTLKGRHRFAVAVCGVSTHCAFSDRLIEASIEVFRSCDLRDDLAQAESLLAHAAARGVRDLCFWNVAPGVKLAVQHFAPPGLRVIDVSPGGYAFEELRRSEAFANALGTSTTRYYRGLHTLVLKWNDPAPPAGARVVIIPNGVALPDRPSRTADRPRFLVSGRIAPSKHLDVIIEAFARFRTTVPGAELHCYGIAEPVHADYAQQVASIAGRGVSFRGACFDQSYFAEPWTAAIVLGTHQGCPNTVLEAMAAGVAVIANDSGGTRELVEPSGGGWLLAQTVEVGELHAALQAAYRDGSQTGARGLAARQWVAAHCTLDQMGNRYLALLDGSA
jgi:glycosyltransferase involved in cell wall biosynthesis